MMHNAFFKLQFFLTQNQDTLNQLGIPKVSNEQMTNGINHIFYQIQDLFQNVIGNYGVLMIIIAVVGLIGCAVFAKKFIKHMLLAILLILLGLIICSHAVDIVGWAMGLI